MRWRRDVHATPREKGGSRGRDQHIDTGFRPAIRVLVNMPAAEAQDPSFDIALRNQVRDRLAASARGHPSFIEGPLKLTPVHVACVRVNPPHKRGFRTGGPCAVSLDGPRIPFAYPLLSATSPAREFFNPDVMMRVPHAVKVLAGESHMPLILGKHNDLRGPTHAPIRER